MKKSDASSAPSPELGKLFSTRRLSLVVSCLLIGLSLLEARFEGAQVDYKEAQQLMSTFDKGHAAKIIFLLTRSRNDFIAVDNRTQEEESKLIEISKALYWQQKMRPSNMKPYVGPPRKKILETEAPSITPGEKEEEPVKPVAELPKIKTAPPPPEKSLPDLEIQKKFQQPSDVIPAVYQRAKSYSENYPGELKNQFLFYSQVLEEIDNETIVAEVLEALDRLRVQLDKKRDIYRNMWNLELPNLERLFGEKEYGRLKEDIHAYKASKRYSELDLGAQDSFRDFSTRIFVLDQCKQKLLDHNFQHSLSADGLVRRFQGNLIKVDRRSLSVVGNSTQQVQTFEWGAVDTAGMVKVAAEILNEDRPEELFLKALSFKVTEQPDLAYDLFWKLMKTHPDKEKISNHMQDCELMYLNEHGGQINQLLQEVHASLKNGDRKTAGRSLVVIRNRLNHPLMAIYYHQVRLIKKKYDL